MRAASPTLAELRTTRNLKRVEYLYSTREVLRDTAERARRWRAFLEANAAYGRAARDEERS